MNLRLSLRLVVLVARVVGRLGTVDGDTNGVTLSVNTIQALLARRPVNAIGGHTRESLAGVGGMGICFRNK